MVLAPQNAKPFPKSVTEQAIEELRKEIKQLKLKMIAVEAEILNFKKIVIKEFRKINRKTARTARLVDNELDV